MQREDHAMPKAVEDCHELLGWMILQLDQFPRSRRFTLGERIESGLLFVLERLIEAAYLKQREDVLKSANLRLDVVRHLWRLSYSVKAISVKAYGQGSERMLGLGRQIGGWRRASSAGQPQS